MDYILCRLSEASTWQGIVVLLTIAGVSLSPEQQGTIATLGMAVVGCIKTFVPDKLGKPGSAPTPGPGQGEHAEYVETISDILRRGRS